MYRKRHYDFQDAIRVASRPVGYGVLLAALILLLFTFLPNAQAQGERCYRWDSRVAFWMPNSGFISGTHDLYGTANCSGQTIGTIAFGQYGATNEWDREDAIKKCNKHNGYSNNDVRPFGLFWSCRPGTTTTTGGQRGGGSSNSKSDSSGGSGGGTPVKKSAPAPERKMTGVNVAAELGMNSGIHFKRLSAFHVGIQSVIDSGILDVVDVWGNAAQYFEVCFPQAGTIVFLDATTSPRSVIEIQNFTKDGYTCAAMDRAGTMVLVQGSGAAASAGAAQPSNQEIAQTFINSTYDPVSTAIDLDTCEVTPLHTLHLRLEPWDSVQAVVPKHTVVAASARTESWFRVTHDEIEGWIAAWLTTQEGDCEWEAEGNDGPALAKNHEMPPDIFSSMM